MLPLSLSINKDSYAFGCKRSAEMRKRCNRTNVKDQKETDGVDRLYSFNATRHYTAIPVTSSKRHKALYSHSSDVIKTSQGIIQQFK